MDNLYRPCYSSSSPRSRQSGVCHRDLKLEQLLLDEAAGAPRLRLADFGTAQVGMI
jgi:serine/threonine protein kinase